MNNFSNFTPRAQQVIQLARKEADRFNHPYVGTEHILLGLIALGQGVAVSVLEKMGIDLDSVRMEVEKAVGQGPETKTVGNVPLTPRAKKVLMLASSEARALNHTYVGTEHVLLGLLREGEGVAANVLRNLSVDLDTTRNEILKMLDPSFEGGEDPAHDEPHPSQAQKAGKVKTPALNAFGRDLTELARKNQLDPVIGRKDELERVIQILCRRTKNNPVLLGEAGVGKTAIVEGLAQSIVEHDVPEIIRNKRVFTLDLALMVAGTKYRGQFEERIKAVIDEIIRSRDVLLFIDELHSIVGAGSAEGAMDAANIIKPALARGDLQCIGATTLDEYRKFIERDAALERRFQSVMVDEPTVDETIAILRGIRSRYEEHHHAQITDESIEAAARLAARYIPDRFLPDKAIDVIDEAGARARIASMTRPPDVKQREMEIEKLRQAKEEAIKEQRFEEAAQLRDRERSEREELHDIVENWRKTHGEKTVVVTTDTVMHVISKWTGVPLTRMGEHEMSRLLNMEEEIERHVIGQSEAVAAISKALRRSRADLKDPRRPIGSFILLGPTGVGKTLLAKSLAEFMFDDADALIQVDMSEYMEKFTVSRLVGSPPGYVGYDEGGQLTEKVRRRPYSVVLFDEVEKAHPDVMHMLLQILEEGKLTDSLGRRVDFRNTVIILTSNLGGELVRKGGTLGFTDSDAKTDYEGLKSRMLDEAKRLFKPEFINRIDDVIVFRQLGKEDVLRIVDLEIAKVEERLRAKGFEITVEPKAREFLVEKGYDPTMGARPLRRAIERYLEDPLAEEILKGRISAPGKVDIGAKDEELTFKQAADKPAQPKESG
ncbi:MAG: ATP-dependent Clp protease ATP-binding subunit [Kiritimatiellae bacterium]|nr:ATP-dependent Clp protease ATP-binding subunit [Kiritimatiellia bacterium]